MASCRSGGLLDEGLTYSIIGAFYEVHRRLGCGYREYIHALALERELVARGHHVDREVAVMVYYRGEPLARQVMDMIVDHRVIVENKVTDRLQQRDSLQVSAICAPRISKSASFSISRARQGFIVWCAKTA